MSIGLRRADLAWIAAGTVVLAALLALALRLGGGELPSERRALKARRMERVDHMRLALAAASDAEKGAVMAITDEDAIESAKQARGLLADVERERSTLSALVKSGEPDEQALARFSEAFATLRGLDEEILGLAVKNTNVKAYRLAYGPAAEAVGAMNAALSRLLANEPDASKELIQSALGAEVAALRIQALLAPHIAEAQDRKMDEMEARMAKDDEAVRADLGRLAAAPKLSADPDLAAARAGYERFDALRKQILTLSRENTNVRSLALSGDRRRKLVSACDDALYRLGQAIAEEPTGATPTNPRGRLPPGADAGASN